MNTFIGTKVIMAKPMTRAAYNAYRGWELPANENGADEGYLVEYVDGGQANDSRHAGYISWSPTDVFKNAYKASGDMSFGHAIEALERGQRVARMGWNGKGMWVELQRPDADSKMSLPYLYLNYPMDSQWTPGARVPWLASQTDMLAKDWTIIS